MSIGSISVFFCCLGSITTIQIPGGGRVGLYQPKHPTALAL